jgi:hypothetical protein
VTQARRQKRIFDILTMCPACRSRRGQTWKSKAVDLREVGFRYGSRASSVASPDIKRAKSAWSVQRLWQSTLVNPDLPFL